MVSSRAIGALLIGQLLVAACGPTGATSSSSPAAALCSDVPYAVEDVAFASLSSVALSGADAKGDGTVVVLDTEAAASNVVVGHVPLGPPMRIAAFESAAWWSPPGTGEVWTGAADTQPRRVFDTQLIEIVDVAPTRVGTYVAGVGRDGSSSVGLYDERGSQVSVVAGPRQAADVEIAATPEGDAVLTAFASLPEERGGAVQSIDLLTASHVRSLRLAGWASHMVLAPDGSSLGYRSTETGDAILRDLVSGLDEVIAHGADAMDIGVDGRVVYAARVSDGRSSRVCLVRP